MKAYLTRVLVAFDTFANVLINGEVGMTISARADIVCRTKKWCVLCNLLDAIQANHCANALSNARLYAQRILDVIDGKIQERYL